MVITVRYKPWSGVKPLHEHQLLRQASLSITCWFADGLAAVIAAPWNRTTRQWQAQITPAQAKAVAFELDYTATVPWNNDSYTVLRIVQGFALVAMPATLPPGRDRAATPSGWFYISPSGARSIRSVPLGLHPLLEFTDPYAPVITINALMVDISDLWDAMHGSKRAQVIRKAMTHADRTTVRVLAHLGGIPYVWFCAIPKAAETAAEVSPHVFYPPSGFGGINYESTTIAGLANPGHDTFGSLVVNTFLLDPIADDEYDAIRPLVPDESEPERARQFRNVTHCIKDDTLGIAPHFWLTPMGMSRAFHQSKVRQVYFLPVRREGFGLEAAQTDKLPGILSSAMHVLWTQSASLAQGSNKPLSIGKYVLSGFSDGGSAMWDAAKANLSRIKGLIAVEAQNTNDLTNKGGAKLGKQVIPEVIAAGGRVVIIGRHKQPNYRPQVDAATAAKIVWLPDDSSTADADGLPKVSYANVWKYPPDVATNHLMTYRTYRLWATDKDFVLRRHAADAQLLATAAAQVRRAKKPPANATHQEIVDRIFAPILATDTHGNYYLHHFAMNGGRKLRLPPLDPKDAYYHVAVAYKTFFQEALEAIG
jgi:hypothetical protein